MITRSLDRFAALQGICMGTAGFLQSGTEPADTGIQCLVRQIPADLLAVFNE